MKRLLDFLAATAGLVVLSPLLAVIAIAVVVNSGRPVFFKHKRVGQNGVDFEVLKFRTMTASSSGPEITSGGDARITKVGGFLRRTKLDELPQLINVARGEMSLVGPRPEVRTYVDKFAAEYAEILTVRPGITDPASLHFRDEEEILAQAEDPASYYTDVLLPAKLELSLDYVNNASLAEDIRLIMATIRAMAK